MPVGLFGWATHGHSQNSHICQCRLVLVGEEGGVGSCVCVLCGVGTIASACHSSAGAEEGNKMGRE